MSGSETEIERAARRLIEGYGLTVREKDAADRALGRALDVADQPPLLMSGAAKRGGLEAMVRAANPKIARPAPPPLTPEQERARDRHAAEQAHGPAWSAGTPRTADEAQAMLGAVEPRHALRERIHHRMQRTLGCVVIEPSPRVTAGEPMPATTMERAEWREAWRVAPVPPLCTLRERCEATSCYPAVRYSAEAAERHGTRPWWTPDTGQSSLGFDQVLRVTDERPRPLSQLRALLFSEGAESVSDSDEHQRRENYRAYPTFAARGWCDNLSGGPMGPALPVNPARAEATWQAMRAAAPERVYPEPGE